MIKKKIVWLTGDYFVDVDMSIVPELKKNYDIKWIVIRTQNSQREVCDIPSIDKIVTIKHRSLSPLSIISYKNLIECIKKEKPELLYVDYIGMPYFFVLLSHVYDMRKVIFMAHNVAPRPTWNWQYKFYYPYIFRHLKNVHVPSTHNIPYIIENYPDLNYTYIPMTVKSFGKPTKVVDKSRKVIFLFFGHVMHNKRLDHLIQAYNTLSDEDKSNSEVIVYGKCQEPERYKKLAQGCDSIKLNFGYAPNEVIPDLFSSSSFLVLPYDNVDQSGPSMIALNYNLPMICSDLEGFKQIVNDGEDGFMYKKDDIDSLSAVLHKCINLSSMEYEMIKNKQAELTKKHFSLEAVAGEYIKMFNRIVE